MPLLLDAGEVGGFEKLLWKKMHLRNGIYLFNGALTNYYLSQRFELKYTDLNLLMTSSGCLFVLTQQKLVLAESIFHRIIAGNNHNTIFCIEG